jgi:hypothetical protein
MMGSRPKQVPKWRRGTKKNGTITRPQYGIEPPALSAALILAHESNKSNSECSICLISNLFADRIQNLHIPFFQIEIINVNIRVDMLLGF